MKAITVRQPWAWAIAVGAKDVENRSMNNRYRGPLAIHAGTGWSNRGATDRRVREAYTGKKFPTLQEIDAVGFARGQILAVADLVDVHPDDGHCCRPWGESEYQEAGGKLRRTIWHYRLEDVRALDKPLTARGALGLWTPNPDLLDALAPAS